MASIFSAGQSISSIGKSMTAIARVEEHLSTFMKKVIYFERFFQRMRSNLPTCVMETATLLFQRCYEYRDDIRDELDSSVAYVADAGRWVVGMGDWNSKMEKRLSQISELVLLANTLLTEYAVTGQVGAGGCRDELNAYLQILSATVTLKNGKRTTLSSRPLRPVQSTAAADFSSEMSTLGTEISGAISEMFRESKPASGITLPEQITRVQSAIHSEDNDTMNPFADSYRCPVDPYATVVSRPDASSDSSGQSVPDGLPRGTGGRLEDPLSDGDTPEGPLSPVMGEYECLDMNSIPKYAAFKSSAQLAARRQSNGLNRLAVSRPTEGGRTAYSEAGADSHELFPLSTKAVSKSLSSLDATAFSTTDSPIKTMMDMNYSYDFQCEVAHNPFVCPGIRGPLVPSRSDTDLRPRPFVSQQAIDLSNEHARSVQVPRSGLIAWSATKVHESEDEAKASVAASETDQEPCHSDEYDLFGVGKS